MRATTILSLAAVLGALVACSGSSQVGPSGGAADNGGAASTGVANNDAGPGPSGAGGPSASGSDPGASDAGSAPSAPVDAGSSSVDAGDAGPTAVDAGPAYDPNACECIPNATRWCDPGTGSDWGKQTCTAGGTWGACAVVSDAPANCKSGDVGFSVFCCLDGSTCCEDKGGLDFGGGSADPNGLLGKDAGGFNGSMSVGACDQIACPNAIASNPWH